MISRYHINWIRFGHLMVGSAFCLLGGWLFAEDAIAYAAAMGSVAIILNLALSY